MEHIKNIIAWELLFILVFTSLLIISHVEQNGLQSITGRAIAGVTQESLLTEIEAAIPQLDFLQDVSDVNICLIVNIDATTKYSYEIVKIGEATAVTSSSELLCKGESEEDFIVSYLSYDKLKQHLDVVPTFEELKQTGDGTNFYLYPSRQILPGGAAADPQEFEDRFGTVLDKYLTSEEKEALLNPPETEQAASLVSYILYFIIGLVVLVLLISVFIFSHTKKPEVKEELELVAYIKSALSQGYAQEQVYQSLVQSGWSPEKVQNAFTTIQTEATAPQQPVNS
jgi:hypothetical protein